MWGNDWRGVLEVSEDSAAVGGMQTVLAYAGRRFLDLLAAATDNLGVVFNYMENNNSPEYWLGRECRR